MAKNINFPNAIKEQNALDRKVRDVDIESDMADFADCDLFKTYGLRYTEKWFNIYSTSLVATAVQSDYRTVAATAVNDANRIIRNTTVAAEVAAQTMGELGFTPDMVNEVLINVNYHLSNNLGNEVNLEKVYFNAIQAVQLRSVMAVTLSSEGYEDASAVRDECRRKLVPGQLKTLQLIRNKRSIEFDIENNCYVE